MTKFPDSEPLDVRFKSEISARIRAEAILSECDPGKLVQIAVTLGITIIEAQRAGGRVIIETDVTDDELVKREPRLQRIADTIGSFMVGDNGRKIKRERLNQIFPTS